MEYIHKGTKVLESSRLLLRRFCIDDAEAMFKYASDYDTTKFMRFPTHQSIADSKAIINLWLLDYEKLNNYNWAIIIKETGELIGSIGLVDVNDFHKQAEIGYIIRKDQWNKGYTTEALKRVLQFGFEEVGFNRLESLHVIENPASGVVMMKAGMLFEGTKRNYFPFKGQYLSCRMYAITSEDFFSCCLYNHRC